MEMLFPLGDSHDSTPLPSQLHSPLHSSLLAVGYGAEGGLVGVRVSGGASIDDMMESTNHPPPSETQVCVCVCVCVCNLFLNLNI